MGRHRKPTAVHALTGAIAHNPGRFADRANEPRINEGLGPPPDSMRPDQRAAWMEIDRLAPWLTLSDRIAVEIAACLLAMFRVTGAEMMPTTLMTRLETILGRLGLTPSDRSKVTVPRQVSASNPFSQCGKRPA